MSLTDVNAKTAPTLPPHKHFCALTSLLDLQKPCTGVPRKKRHRAPTEPVRACVCERKCLDHCGDPDVWAVPECGGKPFEQRCGSQQTRCNASFCLDGSGIELDAFMQSISNKSLNIWG